jgi:uncharacterized DUF497 family protein
MVDIAHVEGFDWDDGNSYKSLLKHSVTNGEAEEIFFNQPLLLLEDFKHSSVEVRMLALGVTNSDRKLLACFTIRNNLIRVISVRDMHKKERQIYEKAQTNSTI